MPTSCSQAAQTRGEGIRVPSAPAPSASGPAARKPGDVCDRGAGRGSTSVVRIDKGHCSAPLSELGAGRAVSRRRTPRLANEPSWYRRCHRPSANARREAGRVAGASLRARTRSSPFGRLRRRPQRDGCGEYGGDGGSGDKNCGAGAARPPMALTAMAWVGQELYRGGNGRVMRRQP